MFLASCATAPGRPSADVASETVPEKSSIHAAVFSSDGSTLYFAVGASQCAIKAVTLETGESKTVNHLSFCPTRLTSFKDGSVLASGLAASKWWTRDGTRLEGRVVLAALDATHLLERTTTGLVWMSGETSVELDPVELRSPRIVTGGTLIGVERRSDGERLVRFDGPSPSGITPIFASIDSWAVSPAGLEVVFSAKRETGFDIGIVPVSGGEVEWVAPDPADERNVTWAPRGNKITYALESVDSSLIRSVHVPTSFQVIFGMPITAVRQIVWEPKAERIAVVIESPGRGPRIDWVAYNGEGRANIVDATEDVATPVEVVLWENGSGALLGPETVRYGQVKPTVLWIDEGDPFAWRPEVARLRGQGIPVVVATPGRLGNPAAALEELPWMNASELYIVDAAGAGTLPESMEFRTLFVREGSGRSGERVEMVSGNPATFRSEVTRRILEAVGSGG